MAARKKPSTIAEAKKAKSKTFYGKGNKKLAAVTKEELEESGLSLRDYLNKQQGKTRRTAAKVAPRPKPRPAPKATVPAPKARVPAPVLKAKASAPKARVPAPVLKAKASAPKGDLSPSSQARRAKPKTILDSGAAPKKYAKTSQRPDSRPVKSTPKSKPRRGSSAPLGGKADPFKYVGKGPRGQKGQAPVPTTEEKVAMAGLALSALGGPGTIAGKAAIKGATKFGKPFITNLIKKIKDLAPKQQKEVLQAANKASTKTAAQKRTSEILKSGGRTQSARRALKRDTISKEAQDAKNTPLTPRPKGQARADATTAAAKRTLGRQEDTTLIGYNKGGKIYKRKEGGQVMSGNDLVSSLYN